MNKLIQEFGFGIIPKHIMKNSNISIQAKGIYSYLCSYAGNTEVAFPGVDLITHELSISRNTFYKYLKELKETGYIEVYKERSEKGTFEKNIYKLLPCPKNPYMDKPDMVKPYTANVDAISNSIISNSITSNSITDIYDFWNTQEIIKHRKLSSKMRRKINTTLKEYSSEEIRQSIKNYAEILDGDKYFFQYRWTLVEFLDRGLEKFMDGEVARQNYIDFKYQKQQKEKKEQKTKKLNESDAYKGLDIYE